MLQFTFPSNKADSTFLGTSETLPNPILCNRIRKVSRAEVFAATSELISVTKFAPVGASDTRLETLF
jgi:hypothetical protein